jgi:hypothetical protein
MSDLRVFGAECTRANPQNVEGLEMSEDSFSARLLRKIDRLRKIDEEMAALRTARETIDQEVRVETEAFLKEARPIAKQILETTIIPKLTTLGQTLAENGLKGWFVDKPDRRVREDGDNLSRSLSYDSLKAGMSGTVQGVIDVGVSVAHEGICLTLSVRCEGGPYPNTSAIHATEIVNDEHLQHDLTDMVGICGWYEKHLEECRGKLLGLKKD